MWNPKLKHQCCVWSSEALKTTKAKVNKSAWSDRVALRKSTGATVQRPYLIHTHMCASPGSGCVAYLHQLQKNRNIVLMKISASLLFIPSSTRQRHFSWVSIREVMCTLRVLGNSDLKEVGFTLPDNTINKFTSDILWESQWQKPS